VPRGSGPVGVSPPPRLRGGPILLILAGVLPALLLQSCAPVAVMSSGMSALVHELGHTVVSNAFGRFAVPAVVMTIAFQQSRLAAAVIWAVVIGFTWQVRRQPVLLAVFAVLAVLYPLFAFTHGYVTLCDLAGHGSELVFAAFFLRRGIGALGFGFGELERPIWSFFGAALCSRNALMGWNLCHSAIYRETYASVSFTGGDNDFTKVSDALGVSIETLGVALMVAALGSAVIGTAWGIRSRREEAKEGAWQPQ
jgi:hypothetical protein